jgi:hypothetical protein
MDFSERALHTRYHARSNPSGIVAMAYKKLTKNILRVSALFGFVAIILVATLVLHVQDHVGDILDWIEDHKLAGAASYVAIYALFTGITQSSSKLAAF